MTAQDRDRQLIEALAFYRELGADCVIAEEAVDWLAAGERVPGDEILADIGGRAMPEVQTAQRPSPRRAAVTTDSGAVAPAARRQPATAPVRQQSRETSAETKSGAAAKALAGGASTLAQLRENLETFEGCALKATAKTTCFYRGAERSRLMVIGEAPGRDEDLAGQPFVGRAGQLLDRMLGAIGLSGDDVHITNVVYWRPPGNRTPTAQETASCRPFLEQQVRLVEPDFVLLLGGSAAKSLLDAQDGIMRLRGKWRDLSLGGRALKALPTLHPAYLLRTPAAKRLAWRDLLSLSKALGDKSMK